MTGGGKRERENEHRGTIDTISREDKDEALNVFASVDRFLALNLAVCINRDLMSMNE